jgi:hypothetical protein
MVLGMNAFAHALSAIFADQNFGSPAVYTPPGNEVSVPCAVIIVNADRNIIFGEGRPFTQGTILEALASQVTPERGGRFVVGLVTYTVLDDPKQLDSEKLVWTVTVTTDVMGPSLDFSDPGNSQYVPLI